MQSPGMFIRVIGESADPSNVCDAHGTRHGTVHVAPCTLHYTSSPMSTASTVVIAPPDLLPLMVDRLRTQQPEGELIACADTDISAAIDRVVAARPDRVSLERLFAATSRGAALLSRLKADPALAHTEFRIVSHDSD